MAAIPHRHVWVSLETAKPAATPKENERDEIATGVNDTNLAGQKVLYFGGRSVKAKVGFERLIQDLERQLTSEFGAPVTVVDNADSKAITIPTLETHSVVESESQKKSSQAKASSKKEQVLAGTATGAGSTENAQGDS